MIPYKNIDNINYLTEKHYKVTQITFGYMTLDEVCESLMLASNILEEKDREIIKLENLIFDMTHHEGALEEYKHRWLPIVEKLLK